MHDYVESSFTISISLENYRILALVTSRILTINLNWVANIQWHVCFRNLSLPILRWALKALNEMLAPKRGGICGIDLFLTFTKLQYSAVIAGLPLPCNRLPWKADQPAIGVPSWLWQIQARVCPNPSTPTFSSCGIFLVVVLFDEPSKALFFFFSSSWNVCMASRWVSC